MYKFSMRVAPKDSTGYFMTRWDSATPVEVFADTREEAAEKARKMLRKPTSHTSDSWAICIDKVEEVLQ